MLPYLKQALTNLFSKPSTEAFPAGEAPKAAEKPAEKVAPVERKKPRASADEELDRLLREYDAPRKKKISR